MNPRLLLTSVFATLACLPMGCTTATTPSAAPTEPVSAAPAPMVPPVAAPVAATRGIYNALALGIVPDGTTNNTSAIAKAIATIKAAGGGTLHFPAGKYLTGSVHLESNLTLDLDAGAELLYSGNGADSPLVLARWECTTAYTHGPLIYADGKENIAITGRGTLNGQGANWWWRAQSRYPAPAGMSNAGAREAWLENYKRIEAGEKLTVDDFKLAGEYLRPSLVGLYNCKNVLVENVTLTFSPMWLLHPVYCEDMVVRGVRFVSAGGGGNGDGIDIDSSRNIRISDCFFSTSDDCIVIKSGRDNDGRRINRPTEFITITNCVMYEGHGAVVIGSETSGGIHDITASNIVAKGTDTGIRLKSMRGRGGVMENFRFDNWVIEDAKKQAFELTSRYGRSEPEPVSDRTPTFRNISYSNITVVNANQVASILGLPEKALENIRFTDVTATGKTGFIVEQASDVEFHNVRVDVTSKSAFSFAEARGLVLADVTSRSPVKGTPVMTFKDTDGIWLRSTRAAPGTESFLKFEGAAPKDLKVSECDFSAAANSGLPAAK